MTGNSVFVGESLADIQAGDRIIIADTSPLGARESTRICRVERFTATQIVCGGRLQTRFSRSTGRTVGGSGRILLGTTAERALARYVYQQASRRIARQLAAIQQVLENSRDNMAIVDVIEKALAHAIRVAEKVSQQETGQ